MAGGEGVLGEFTMEFDVAREDFGLGDREGVAPASVCVDCAGEFCAEGPVTVIIGDFASSAGAADSSCGNEPGALMASSWRVCERSAASCNAQRNSSVLPRPCELENAIQRVARGGADDSKLRISACSWDRPMSPWACTDFSEEPPKLNVRGDRGVSDDENPESEDRPCDVPERGMRPFNFVEVSMPTRMVSINGSYAGT